MLRITTRQQAIDIAEMIISDLGYTLPEGFEIGFNLYLEDYRNIITELNNLYAHVGSEIDFSTISKYAVENLGLFSIKYSNRDYSPGIDFKSETLSELSISDLNITRNLLTSLTFDSGMTSKERINKISRIEAELQKRLNQL